MSHDFYFWYKHYKQERQRRRFADSADTLVDTLHEHVQMKRLDALAALLVEQEDAAIAQKQADHAQWEAEHPGLAFAARNRRRWQAGLE